MRMSKPRFEFEFKRQWEPQEDIEAYLFPTALYHREKMIGTTWHSLQFKFLTFTATIEVEVN